MRERLVSTVASTVRGVIVRAGISKERTRTNMSRYTCTLRTVPVTLESDFPRIVFTPSTWTCAIIWFEWKPEESSLNPGPRPWQSSAVPPQVEVFAWQGMPSNGWPGDSQKAPRLRAVSLHSSERKTARTC